MIELSRRENIPPKLIVAHKDKIEQIHKMYSELFHYDFAILVNQKCIPDGILNNPVIFVTPEVSIDNI